MQMSRPTFALFTSNLGASGEIRKNMQIDMRPVKQFRLFY